MSLILVPRKRNGDGVPFRLETQIRNAEEIDLRFMMQGGRTIVFPLPRGTAGALYRMLGKFLDEIPKARPESKLIQSLKAGGGL